MLPPILWIMIVGIASLGISMGFLMPAIPSFNLQGVAINEENFSVPITTANVDIEISKIEGVNLAGSTVFKNRINQCSFHTPSTGLGSGSTIICKLTDSDGDVVAEGRLNLPTGLASSELTFIDIVQTAFFNSNEVQNIDDIKIVILGTNPTCGGIGQPLC